MRLRSLAVPTLLLISALPARAQQGPPLVLVMTREQFRPGNMATHNKQIPSFYALFEKAKVGAPRLGVVPVSGDQNHILYLEIHPSYADFEATGKKMDEVMSAAPALQAEMDALTKANDPLHESQTVMMAVRRDDLSYHPRTPAEIGKVRFINLAVTRVNTGRGADYADYIKQANAAREKAHLDEHTSVWQVTSGAPGGTFLTFNSSASMAEADAAYMGGDARAKKVNEALGGEVVVKARQKMFADIVATATTTTYRVDRGISRPAPEYIAADPVFWKPMKPMEAPKPVKK